MKFSLKLKPATIHRDAKNLYDLRNDPEVYCNCFQDKPVRWSEHLTWLEKAYRNPNCKILVLEINGDFAGQVRIDESKLEIAEISISLTKSYRGKGLASKVIIDVLKWTDRDAIALIKRNNIASIKAFASAGFGTAE